MKLTRVIVTALCCFSANLWANSLSFEQVSKDIQFLADDSLKGRAAFTPEIDKAADYIADRFKAIGLKPLVGQKNFKQEFEVYHIKPKSQELQLNNSKINSQSIMTISSHQKLNWKTPSEFKVVGINAEQDFRKAISEINQKNHNLLVLISPKHQAMFKRYQAFIARGLTKFATNKGPSAVFVVSEDKSVDSINFSLVNSITTKKLTNVVGIIPGSDLGNENVLFSAHYDHVGLNEKLEGDKIFNGADDDASGTTAVINLAEYYAKQGNNRRTLMFVAFTAEEIGGFGSKFFSKQVDPNSISAMINIEMIGKPSKFGAGELWMTGYDRSNLAELLNKNLKDGKVHPDPYPAQNLFYRSDNATLAKLGVPAHSFSSSQIDIDKHYHQVSDEVATLDLKSMYQVIESLAQATQGLSQGTDTPTRVDTSKVKPSGVFF